MATVRDKETTGSWAYVLGETFLQHAQIRSLDPEYRCGSGCFDSDNKNSSGDEIANVNFLTTISHTRRPTSKYRKRDKATSFNKLDDR